MYKVIFGKEFDDICSCTFKVDNPTTEDLIFIKKNVDIRIQKLIQVKNHLMDKL